jgi:hypothetical protein
MIWARWGTWFRRPGRRKRANNADRADPGTGLADAPLRDTESDYLGELRREGSEPEAPTIPDVLAGTIRAVLRPRGLIEVAGLIEPARWESDEPSPPRDSVVQVARATDENGWIATPLPPLDGTPATGTEVEER